ncbi:MAG: 6,7-dimethyl-8-ribityllumazine synthase [Chlamydiales bacterium]|jgi:6,7-dimethyl-8-ribityllumazine synthase|nr:6,7-dimethyl-8-ribityllumazine synthase [Chlamydiales bacterium]
MTLLEITGQLQNAFRYNYAIVISRFNSLITQQLLEGAISTLKQYGVPESQITICWVPGAFEIPLIANQLAKLKKYQAIICLGCVIRGETSHYDYVCNQMASGIAQLSLTHDLPVLFGVVTTENLEQAMQRAGGKAGNKGSEVAIAAIEMVDLVQSLKI